MLTLDGAGVVLAFVLAGISIGSWAAYTTMQLRSLRKAICSMHERFDALVDAMGLRPHMEAREAHESDRHPARVLDDSAPTVFGAHRDV